MSITTNVPNNLERPQTFHVFNYLNAGGALVSIPLTVALIGTMAASGTAVAGTVYDVGESAQTDALFGVNSELAIACRAANAATTLFQRGPRVKAVPIAEPGAGVANVKTVTAVGTATADGNAIVKIAGRTVIVGIRVGDAQNTVAASLHAAAQAIIETLPVRPTVATNVVTLTHPTKGINGTNIIVTVEQQVAGVVLTVANTVVGSGVADHQVALTALSPLRYDGIAFANHAAADITQILTDIATRWSASSKTWGYYFIGEPGTIGTATSLAAAANHQSVIVANFEGCLNTAAEIAAVTAVLVFSRERANASYDRATVPLFPPAAAVLYTGPEVETAIAAGLTVFTGVIDSTGAVTQNRARVERLVTSKTTTGGQPDKRNRDIAVSRVGIEIAIQLDIASEQALGADANPDGITQEDSDDLIKDLAAAILRAEARAKVISQRLVEADVAAIQLEHDPVSTGRTNVLIPYHPALPLHQIAWVHNVLIGT